MATRDFQMSLASRVSSWLQRGDELVSLVTAAPDNVAPDEFLNSLFRPDYVPGLFKLSERKGRPDFLKDEDCLDYEAWVADIVRSDVMPLNKDLPLEEQFDEACVELLTDGVICALELPFRGRPLCESHTNQEADHIIWRIIKVFLIDDPETQFHTQSDFNELGRYAVLPIIPYTKELSLDELWRISIDAGLVGADIEDEFPGMRTSRVSLNRVIPLGSRDGPNSSIAVRDELFRRRNEKLRIDFRQEYCEEVLAKEQPCSLVWLSDNYIETIFDLRLLEAQMGINPNLQVTLAPRDGQYGDDASYDDVMSLLAEPAFEELYAIYRTGRFGVCKEGPRTSSINGRKISAALAMLLREADVVFVKGARGYEMLQGLKKPTYFCMSVVCSFSESLTGLDMDRAEDMLIRQDSGIRSFDDFRARAYRRHRLPSGREVGLAKMTALEYAQARRSDKYQSLVDRFQGDVDACNEWINETCRKQGRTLAQVVQDS